MTVRGFTAADVPDQSGRTSCAGRSPAGDPVAPVGSTPPDMERASFEGSGFLRAGTSTMAAQSPIESLDGRGGTIAYDPPGNELLVESHDPVAQVGPTPICVAWRSRT